MTAATIIEGKRFQKVYSSLIDSADNIMDSPLNTSDDDVQMLLNEIVKQQKITNSYLAILTDNQIDKEDI